ncbi:MAG: IS30 family transposase [Sporichthyaceae bacterium]
MRTGSTRRPGRQPMVDKQREFARLLSQGVSISEACRRLGIDRKTGHWWKNGGVIRRSGAERRVAPVIDRLEPRVESPRYLSLAERVAIADGHRAGKSARTIAQELGRAVSTVARELKRNRDNAGDYKPYRAHNLMLARRPRTRRRILAENDELRAVVQGLLDKHWSPELIARELRVVHGRSLSIETIYQALYSPERTLARESTSTRRRYRRPRRRGNERRPRFIVPIRLIDERPAEVLDRLEPGHWEGDLIVGAFNRSAIGTLVERTTRFTMLIHLDGPSRAEALRDRLNAALGALPPQLRRTLTWDQGSEMCHHHAIAANTGMHVYFCHPGRPWERPTNENTNGLLRDYFPKGSNLAVHTATDLQRVVEELNQRPRKILGWQTPEALFASLRTGHV